MNSPDIIKDASDALQQISDRGITVMQDATDNSRPNETAEVVMRESAEETNTELLQSIDKKLDMLLAAQTATQAAKEE